MFGADSTILTWINQWPEGLAPLMHFFSTGLETWPVRLVFLATIAFLLWKPSTRATVLLLILGIIIANEITDAFKTVIPMPRPFQVEGVILRVGWSDSMGTASAHAANMMSVAVCFLLRHGRASIPWFVLAVGVGISRIYNGVHYPSQVLLGWACGAFAAFLVYRTFLAYLAWRQRRAGVKPGSSGASSSDRGASVN